MGSGRGKQPSLYVATSPEKRNDPFFKTLKRHFRLIFGTRVSASPAWKHFLKAHAVPSSLHTTMFGLCEQLICARARIFLGTPASSFSASIRKMRIKSVLPQRNFVLACSRDKPCWYYIFTLISRIMKYSWNMYIEVRWSSDLWGKQNRWCQK